MNNRWGYIMDNDKIEALLLQLIQDMAEVKAKINNIDEQRLSSRIDLLEAQAREQDRIIKSLEKRSETLENFTREKMLDTSKTMRGAFISGGLAILTAIISLLFNLL